MTHSIIITILSIWISFFFIASFIESSYSDKVASISFYDFEAQERVDYTRKKRMKILYLATAILTIVLFAALIISIISNL